MQVGLEKRDDFLLSLRIPYKLEWVGYARQLKESRWIPKEKVWVFAYTLSNVERFVELFSGVGFQVEAALLEE